jgi:hypothetical protein
VFGEPVVVEGGSGTAGIDAVDGGNGFDVVDGE